VFDVLQVTWVCGLPPEKLLGEGAGGGHVATESRTERHAELRDGERSGWRVQVAGNGLGDIADSDSFVADRVQHSTDGRLLDSTGAPADGSSPGPDR
jgi:hypothetical protein